MATKQRKTSSKNIGKIFHIQVQSEFKPIKSGTNPVTAPQNLETYFDFGYYFGIIPFRIRVEKGHPGRFVVHRNPYQRVVCGIQLCLTILLQLSTLSQELIVQTAKADSRIILYFNVVQYFTWFLMEAYFSANVWSRKGQVRVVNLFQSSVEYENSFRKSGKGSVFGSVWVSRIICLIGAIIIILAPFEKLGEKEAGPCTLIRGLAKDAKMTWSFGKYAGNCTSGRNTTQSGMPTTVPSAEGWEIALICFDFLANLSETIISIVVISGISVFVLHLNHGTEYFVQQLRRNGENSENRKELSFDILQITEQFHKLKELSESANEIICSTLFFFWISALTFAATDLDLMFTEPGWLGWFSALYYVAIDIIVFWKGAEICEKMGEFHFFLVQGDLPIGFERRILLLEELATQPVGIRGLNKFVIDNKFLTNMATLLITLIVVLIQSKSLGEHSGQS